MKMEELQIMIMYFSGTGNSHYIAKRIADKLHDNLLNINDKLKENDTKPVSINKRLVIVTPTYAWRIPEVVNDWICRTEFQGVEWGWFVMTCGGEIGNAEKYNRKLCGKKNFSYLGTAQIVMPENYIALFGTPEPEEARKIVSDAEPVIEKVIEDIAAGSAFPAPRNNFYDRFMSGPINKIFYPLCVKSKSFRTGENCVACKKCVNVCPLNNITLKNRKPVWGNKCTHCMACISYCPTKTIEYGKHSLEKTRYTFEKF